MVYRARLEGPQGFEKDVAIKLLTNTNPSEGVLARFRDEARLLGLCRDRGIVAVDPPIRLGGQWAVVMELVDGTSCEHLLHHRALPPRIALEIIEEVARTLDNLWNHPGNDGQPLHLVHRDVKPANIQVTPSGNVKILDFGIARAAFRTREASTSDHIGGTVGYIAPERLDGEEGSAGDVYSLGVVLHELVVGKRPTGRAASPPPDATPDMKRALELAARMRASEPSARPVARQVEMVARSIRLEMPGADLRDWARGNVPVTPGQSADQRVGTLLSESLSDVPVAPSLPSAFSRRSRGLAVFGGAAAGVLVAGAALVSLLVAVVVAIWWSVQPAPTVSLPPPPPPAEPQTPRPQPNPAPPPDAPEKAPPAGPTTGTVRLEGDAKDVELIGSEGQRARPGPVPPGTWSVSAVFSEGPVPAGTVTVRQGETVTLRCSAAFQRCVAR